MSKTPQDTKMFGKYRLLAHLATGGMAEVLLASHTGLANFEKLVVIKLILPHLSKEKRFIDMFLDEARIAAMLNHQNVVQVFDLGIEDGRYFIAMEYLPGESLSYLVRTMRKDGQALPPHLAAGIVMQAADGLHHAHQAVDNNGKSLRIVHRDISPQNIFVLYDGGVKVVDFGIAKATLNTTKTRTGTLKGKYAYMSPEQILGKELDGRSDVFSLGVVLWECLTGQKLFTEQSDLKLLQSITDGEISAPAEVNPALPWDLSNMTMKALERDRNARFGSAREFRESLSRFLKKTEEEGDTAAIAKFMHKHFTGRIQKKQQLVKGAQEAKQDLHQALFGDLNSILSDTEQSIPRTPLEQALVAQKPSGDVSSPASADLSINETSSSLVMPRKTLLPYMLLAVFLSLVFLGIVYFLGDGDSLDSVSNPSDSLHDNIVQEADAGSGAVIVSSSEKADGGLVSNIVPQPADAQARHMDEKDRTSKLAHAEKTGDGVAHKNHSRKKKRKKTHTSISQAKPDGGVAHPVNSEEPREVAAVKETGTGRLRLTTEPWADIYIDGKKIGQTPLVDVEVPAGNIKMRAVNKDAGLDRVFFIRIKKDRRTIKRLNFF